MIINFSTAYKSLINKQKKSNKANAPTILPIQPTLTPPLRVTHLRIEQGRHSDPTDRAYRHDRLDNHRVFYRQEEDKPAKEANQQLYQKGDSDHEATVDWFFV